MVDANNKQQRLPIGEDVIPFYRLLGSCPNIERLASNSVTLGQYTKIKVLGNVVEFSTAKNRTVLTFPSALMAISSKSKIQQVFAFTMCGILRKLIKDGELTENTFSFNINELVELGIYNDYQAAKKGMSKIARQLTLISVFSSDEKVLDALMADRQQVSIAGVVLFPTYKYRGNGFFE